MPENVDKARLGRYYNFRIQAPDRGSFSFVRQLDNANYLWKVRRFYYDDQ